MVGRERVVALSADAVGDVESVEVFAECFESAVQFRENIDVVGYGGVVDVLFHVRKVWR